MSSTRPPLESQSSRELLKRSPSCVAARALNEAAHRDNYHLTPPIDTTLLTEPANVIRPTRDGRLPRRMSISDSELIDRALATFTSTSPSSSQASRPSSAEVARRTRTRVHVSTSQSATQSPTEVFCLAYSLSGQELVAGCGDGSLRVFEAGTNKSIRVKHHVEDTEHLPTTCIRFNQNGTMLLAATADGTISHWNIMDADAACVRSFKEPTTSVYAIATDDKQFATGGRDHIVRIYDEETGKLIRACDNTGAHGHSNRIFALRYHPSPNVLLSGGWDNTVQVWDIRTGSSVRSFFGPHICGDGLDVRSSGDEILTGSWREENALQRWDFGMGKVIQNISWVTPTSGSTSVDSSKPDAPCMLYACAYSPDETMIAAGGAGNGVNQAKIFDLASGISTERVSFHHALYALAFSPDGTKLALGGVDPQMTIVNL